MNACGNCGLDGTIVIFLLGVIRIPSRTNVTLINLVPKIEYKLGIEWNHDPMLNESTNLGM